jgi:hypothetical protein
MNNIKILVGADPEIFMQRDGVFMSAHGAIPGDKKNPHKVDKGAVQVDGMALEFNIDPASNEQEFVDNLSTVLATLKGMVPDYNLVACPVAEFSEEYMKAQPPEALEMGCEPDFNAWLNGAVNPRPDGKVNFRTGAGHIHIGWGDDFDINSPEHQEACCMVVKQLDYYLGLPSLAYDSDTKRRTLYGAAGAYRPKSYGVEYRVLSNAWLGSKELMAWVYRTTDKAIQDLFNGYNAETWGRDYPVDALMDEAPSMVTVARFMVERGITPPPGFKFFNNNWDETLLVRA